MPSSVTSSGRSTIRSGLRSSRSVRRSVSAGIVAENSASRADEGSSRTTPATWSSNPSWSISSASSITSRLTSRAGSTASESMCRTRPGVPTTTCGVLCRSREMSSRTGVPPTRLWTTRPSMCAPSASITSAIWSASSRVGASTSACGARSPRSISARSPIPNAPVLPVPLCACARTSRSLRIGKMARR
eukprot:Amastigsp_a175720_87.p4 type:complete len:189 gc:universal Amastigsp_a175720_87:790-224(-)